MKKLQWGHAFSGVETYYREIFLSKRITLQWGHAFSGVETRQFGVDYLGYSEASMGPRLFRRGNLSCTV